MENETNYYPLPQPEVKNVVPQQKASDTAFYTAAAAKPIEAEETFNEVYTGLTEEGESLLHDQFVAQYNAEQDKESKRVIGSLIADETVDKDYKMKALQNYTTGGFISNDLRQRYIVEMASADTGENDAEVQAQDEIIPYIPQEISTLSEEENKAGIIERNSVATEQRKEDAMEAIRNLKSIPKKIAGEVSAFLNLLENSAGGAIDFVNRAAEVGIQLKEGKSWDDIDFTKIEQQTRDRIAESGTDLEKATIVAQDSLMSPEEGISAVAEELGLQDVLNDSYVNAGIEKLGEGIIVLAEDAVERGLFEDVESAMFALEGAASVLGVGIVLKGTFKAAKSVQRAGRTKQAQVEGKEKTRVDGVEQELNTRSLKEALKTKKAKKNNYKASKARKNSPAKVTEKANPNAAKKLLAVTVADKADGNKPISYRNETGKSKLEIIEDNILPDAKVNADTPKVTVDINSTLDKILPVNAKKLLHDESVLAVLFDDTIVKREARISDLERRLRVNEETALVYNQASSKMNITSDFLEGESVFTQGDGYPFTTRKQVIDQAETLEALVHKMEATENAADVAAGLGTLKQVAKQQKVNKVQIREVNSGVVMSLAEFKKTNLKRGKYQVEHKYKKKYDLLSNEMLGESLKDKYSQIGGLNLIDKYLGTNLNKKFSNSVISEFFVGTGYSAKWYERARADLGNRAATVARKPIEDFTKIMVKNKDIRQPMVDLIHLQERMKRDVLTRVEVQRNFKELKTKDIDDLMAAQEAWRKANNTMYEITNIGEKQRLATNGYHDGFFVDGVYKGAVKEVKPAELKTLNKETLVYDPSVDDYVKYTGTDMKIVRMDGNMLGQLRKNGVESDYIVVGKNQVSSLPHNVVNKLPGHSFKQYKSNFFIEAVPKKLNRNGKNLSEGEIRHSHMETRGVANTKAQAITLIKQMEDPNSKNYIGDDYEVVQTPRNASLDNIKDHLFEYRLQEDIYKNTLTRAEDLKQLDGSKVLQDPLYSFNESARRIAKTATATQFHKAYTEAFMRDFKQVLDTDANGVPIYPTNIEAINAIGKKGNRVELESLVKDARAIWRRNDTFQRSGSISALDRATQNGLHSLADIFEKVPGQELVPNTIRDIGNHGFTGLSNTAKKYASLAYITLQNPARHLWLQVSPLLEMLPVHPKSAPTVMKYTYPVASAILDAEGSILAGATKGITSGMSKASKAEVVKLANILKKEGILDSINQNTAAIQTVKARVPKLEAPENAGFAAGRAIAKGGHFIEDAANNIGFARGELLNRVGTWLLVKERWLDNPVNKGKAWDSPRSIKEISHEAWELTGAMTSSGALKMQSVPVLNFFTQFQAILFKLSMNIFQKNATSFTLKDRTVLSAHRLLQHGVEDGLPLGAGYLVYDYLFNSEDPEVRERAATLRVGVQDRMLNGILNVAFGKEGQQEYDFAYSKINSINSINPLASVVENAINIGMFIKGDRDAQSPRFPVQNLLTSVSDKVNNIINILAYNEVTPEVASQVFREGISVTAIGNNTQKALLEDAYGNVLNKHGAKLGIPVPHDDTVRMVMSSIGIRTRAEYDLYKAKRLVREDEDLVKSQVEHYSEVLSDNLKYNPEDAEVYLSKIRNEINLLIAGDKLTQTQAERVYKGVMSKQLALHNKNDTANIISWALNQDKENAELKRVVAYLRSNPDPKVQEVLDIIENKVTFNIGDTQ